MREIGSTLGSPWCEAQERSTDRERTVHCRSRVGHYCDPVTSTADAAALIPPDWLAEVSGLPAAGESNVAQWVAGLPRQLAARLTEWELHPVGFARTGRSAIVVPVEREGERFGLKLVPPHPSGAAESLALRLWDGTSTVRLVAAAPTDGVLLLEWLDPDHDLADPSIDTDTACEIIGGLLLGLHLPAPPNLPTAAHYYDRHLHGRTGLATAGDHLPRRAVDRALGLASDLLARPDATATVTHRDLHFAHVLAGERHPWLAISPHPLAGHPGLEIWPLLRHRVDELGTGAALRWSVRHRLEIVCEAAGIDEDLARWWTIVESTLEAHRASREDRREHVSHCLAVAKALDA